MKSDYFRYSYIFVKGGFYIDADDVYHGTSIDHLFEDGRLKLQPFCYDIETSRMVAPCDFVNFGADKLSWIFYFNTTPLIAASNHPIVKRVLFNATEALESVEEFPEVHATTGTWYSHTINSRGNCNGKVPRKRRCWFCTIGRKSLQVSGH